MAIEGETERAGRADRFDREEPAGRAEGRQADASTVGCLAFAAIVLLPALLYFGLFGAILIDELVLETHWIVGALPEPVLEILRIIYSPLIWLMDQFDG